MQNERLQAFVDEVAARTDLLQVVQTYVPLKRKGGRYWGCCPFHQEKTPSFSVEPEKGFFYCFGCHAGGNAFKFLSLIENISYFDAIKLQAEKLGIELPRRKLTPAEEKRERERKDLLRVNEMARDFFHNCLTITKIGEPGRAYLAKRGITEATIKAFSLGFAPPAWDKLSAAFQRRGVTEGLLLDSGLCLPRREGGGIYDRFRGRMMIPIADERGRVVGFGGRVLDDSVPKYLNTPETILFNKRYILFGLDRARHAIAREGYAIIVEGYMDAIAVFGAGIENVVATLGTAFTVEHAKKLMRYATRLIFCYDSDEAGQSATIRALSILQNTGAEVSVLRVPDGKDPDEFIRKNGADAFRALTRQAVSLVDFRMEYVLSHTRHDTLSGKVQALHQMAPVFQGMRGGAMRTEYVKRLASALMLEEDVVRDELARGTGSAMTEPARAPIRREVRRVDTALDKAGRVLIRLAAEDGGKLAEAESIVPLASVLGGIQLEILEALKKGLPAVELQGSLSDGASAEISRALVDEGLLAGRTEEEAWRDALRVLKKAYLNQQYMEHSQLAEKYLEEGNPTYRVELQRVEAIKHELAEMESV